MPSVYGKTYISEEMSGKRVAYGRNIPVFWSPHQLDPTLPVYLAIVEALEGDILSGRLRAGEKLPPQRILAQKIGVDFTTVSRAYKQAIARSLVYAQVGKGTFVCGMTQQGPVIKGGVGLREIDMGMNIPPLPDDTALIARLKREMSKAVARLSTQALFGYHDFVGSYSEREQAAGWVSRRYEGAIAERLMICPGTQSTLLALMMYLVKSDDKVCCEELVYPGFKSLCQRLNIDCLGLEMDEDGLCPDGFRTACRENRVRMLYCTPTMHNPTCATWSRKRREEIAAIAREFDVLIVEDDAYGFISGRDIPVLSSFAPERSFHIAGLSKCVSSGVRISFLTVPDVKYFSALSIVMRSSAMMVAAPSKAIALQLLKSGCADLITQAICQEAYARQEILQAVFPEGDIRTDKDGFHAWLSLPEQMPARDFVAGLRARAIRVVPSDVFALAPHYPNGVRICLGVPENRSLCRSVLLEIRDVYLNGIVSDNNFV